MEEKRKLIRQRTFKAGRIYIPFHPGVDCIVRNLTKDGAALEVVGHMRVPDTGFDLIIKPEDLRRNCQVIWRQLNKIGVRFI